MEYERTGILTSISGAIKRNSYLIKVDQSLMAQVHALVGQHVKVKYKDNDTGKVLSAIERFGKK